MPLEVPDLIETPLPTSPRRVLVIAPLVVLLVPVLVLWALLKVLWSVVRLKVDYSYGAKEQIFWRRKISRTVLLGWYVSNVTYGIFQVTHGDLRLLREKTQNFEALRPLLNLPSAPSSTMNLPGWTDGVAIGLLVLMLAWAFQPVRRRPISRLIDSVLGPIFNHVASFREDFEGVLDWLRLPSPRRRKRERRRRRGIGP